MKQITAEEFYKLINSEEIKNKNHPYWEKEISTETYQAEVRTESSVDRCFDGYGGWDSGSTSWETRTRVVTKYSLNLARFLKYKGYEAEIYPIQLPFSIEEIEQHGRKNIFNVEKFDARLLTELKWCLKHAALEHGQFDKIIPKLSKQQLDELYQSDIKEGYKSEIYNKCPDCDPIRKLKNTISGQLELAAQTIKASSDLAQANTSYNQIEILLTREELKDQEKYLQETNTTLYKKRLELAHQATRFKQYKLAQEIYTQLIDNQKKQPELDIIVYLERAFVHYSLKSFAAAHADLDSYKKQVKNKKFISYWLYRGLTYVGQGKHESAARRLYNLAIDEDEPAKQKLRLLFIQRLSKDEITTILANLLTSAQNEKLSPEKRKIYKAEHITYIKIAADLGHDIAQLRLSEMLWNNDRLQAEMWLGRAAANNNSQAQLRMAQIFKENIKPENNIPNYQYQKIKTLLKRSVEANYEPSKVVMQQYHQTLADSYKTDAPITHKNKKRKTLLDTLANETSIFELAPPFNLETEETSPLDVYLDAKDSAKRVWIPDTTPQMIEKVERAHRADNNANKRNYLAANLTLIFANGVKKEERTIRLVKTIAIDDTSFTKNVNVENLFKEFNKTKVKERHKLKLDAANSTYTKLSKGKLIPEEDQKKLAFIPETESKSYNPNTHKHSENALYEYLSNEANLKRLFNVFKTQHKAVFKPGCKVYGVILDLYSINSSCTDCRKLTLTIPNHPSILGNMQKVLQANGHPCLTKRKPGFWEGSKLYMLIRIRAGQKLNNGKNTLTDTDIIPTSRNLKEINNHLFFHKIENPEKNTSNTDSHHLIFESGTNAAREKRKEIPNIKHTKTS